MYLSESQESVDKCLLTSEMIDFNKLLCEFCVGEDVRRYISGPPGPPGPPGAPSRGSGRPSNQEVAERVLSLMNGTGP